MSQEGGAHEKKQFDSTKVHLILQVEESGTRNGFVKRVPRSLILRPPRPSACTSALSGVRIPHRNQTLICERCPYPRAAPKNLIRTLTFQERQLRGTAHSCGITKAKLAGSPASSKGQEANSMYLSGCLEEGAVLLVGLWHLVLESLFKTLLLYREDVLQN